MGEGEQAMIEFDPTTLGPGELELCRDRIRYRGREEFDRDFAVLVDTVVQLRRRGLSGEEVREKLMGHAHDLLAVMGPTKFERDAVWKVTGIMLRQILEKTRDVTPD
jgi:hypothetical protein